MKSDNKTKNELIAELESIRKKLKKLETLLKKHKNTKQNITERLSAEQAGKRAEEELKKSEEKYRSIFENVQDVYFETLFNSTILEISPSIEFVTKGQYRRTDLIGRSMYDFYNDPNERHTMLVEMNEKGCITDFEVQFKNRDGSILTCSLSLKAKLDAEGQPEKIIGSMRDISERKRMEKELKKCEEKHRLYSSSGEELK